ncbi:sulfurtransferase [Cupriavidus sp. PET2-C1]
MPYSLLISPEQLANLANASVPHIVFDCTADLTEASLGHQQYLDSHIPGSIHADLDLALSAKGYAGGAPASGGRHPLPARDRFAQWLGDVGFSNEMQAVVYDRNGTNFCGRLWWMLKWVGHDAVAVLDGGLQAWHRAGGAIASGIEAQREQTTFALGNPLRALVDAQQVAANLDTFAQTLIDARVPARFRGEVEPLDAYAGHIPGALNRPFSANLEEDGRFKSAEQLKVEFQALLGDRDFRTVVHQCGSGVSATPNLLAMEIAGLGPTALYAGSWSDWCSVPSRPRIRG